MISPRLARTRIALAFTPLGYAIITAVSKDSQTRTTQRERQHQSLSSINYETSDMPAVESAFFIFGDGDRTRDRIESLLFKNDIAGLSSLSLNLSTGIAHLARSCSDKLRASVVIAGGDDLLLQVNPSDYDPATLRALGQEYQAETGTSISFGVGRSIAEAYINLRRAKVAGGGLLVDPETPHE
jgi:hypothetical protein